MTSALLPINYSTTPFFHISSKCYFFFFRGATDQFESSPPPFEASTSHAIMHTQPVGLFQTTDGLVTQPAATQHTINLRTSKLLPEFELITLAIKRPHRYVSNCTATVKFKVTHSALLSAKLNLFA